MANLRLPRPPTDEEAAARWSASSNPYYLVDTACSTITWRRALMIDRAANRLLHGAGLSRAQDKETTAYYDRIADGQIAMPSLNFFGFGSPQSLAYASVRHLLEHYFIGSGLDDAAYESGMDAGQSVVRCVAPNPFRLLGPRPVLPGEEGFTSVFAVHDTAGSPGVTGIRVIHREGENWFPVPAYVAAFQSHAPRRMAQAFQDESEDAFLPLVFADALEEAGLPLDRPPWSEWGRHLREDKHYRGCQVFDAFLYGSP